MSKSSTMKCWNVPPKATVGRSLPVGEPKAVLLPLVSRLEAASHPFSTWPLLCSPLIGAGAATSTLLKVWGAMESLKMSSLYFWAAHLEAGQSFSVYELNKKVKTNRFANVTKNSMLRAGDNVFVFLKACWHKLINHSSRETRRPKVHDLVKDYTTFLRRRKIRGLPLNIKAHLGELKGQSKYNWFPQPQGPFCSGNNAVVKSTSYFIGFK